MRVPTLVLQDLDLPFHDQDDLVSQRSAVFKRHGPIGSSAWQPTPTSPEADLQRTCRTSLSDQRQLARSLRAITWLVPCKRLPVHGVVVDVAHEQAVTPGTLDRRVPDGPELLEERPVDVLFEVDVLGVG